jgi:dTDP-4-amino-4,6-dideoxygalactose transaminase
MQKAAASLGYGAGSFPVTERQAGRILSLPVYPELDDQQVEYVAECVRSFYD